MSEPAGGRVPKPPVADDAAAAPSGDRLLAVALPEIAEVTPGDDLGRLAAEAWWSLTLEDPELAPRPGDVLVVTQKVVSKAEGRLVRLAEVEPRAEAVAFARGLGQGPAPGRGRAARVGRVSCAWSAASSSAAPATASCAPTPAWTPPTSARRTSSRSCRRTRTAPRPSCASVSTRSSGVYVGVIISDSFGRPWRWGITDVALGVAGFLPLDDLRGTPDAGGRTMQATVVAVADELASVAELASGKTSRRPLVMIRGARLPAGAGSVTRDVVMAGRDDLFP